MLFINSVLIHLIGFLVSISSPYLLDNLDNRVVNLNDVPKECFRRIFTRLLVLLCELYTSSISFSSKFIKLSLEIPRPSRIVTRGL